MSAHNAPEPTKMHRIGNLVHNFCTSIIFIHDSQDIIRASMISNFSLWGKRDTSINSTMNATKKGTKSLLLSDDLESKRL